MNSFEHTHPVFQGFDEFYAKDILPELIDREQDRLDAFAEFKKMATIVIGAILLVGALSFFTIAKHPMFLAVSGIFSCASFFGLKHHFLKNVKKHTKYHLVSGICYFIDWAFSETVDEPPVLDPLIENGLLPRKYDRVTFEDKMTGNVHDADFEAVECHMEREDRDSDGDRRYVTVFRGSIMAIDFHREFEGRTVVLRDKRIFNTKKKAGMKRVGLESPKFEKIFEAYGTDQVEARYLLTPTFMQRLIDLETSVEGKNIRFAFLDGMLLIAVETQNRFEAGSMNVPLTDPKRTQDILNEVAAVYGVVDGLMAGQVRSRSKRNQV